MLQVLYEAPVPGVGEECLGSSKVMGLPEATVALPWAPGPCGLLGVVGPPLGNLGNVEVGGTWMEEDTWEEGLDELMMRILMYGNMEFFFSSRQLISELYRAYTDWSEFTMWMLRVTWIKLILSGWLPVLSITSKYSPFVGVFMNYYHIVIQGIWWVIG